MDRSQLDLLISPARKNGVTNPHLAVSPGQEAVLPNVPPENIQAMAAAAMEV